MLFTSGRWSKRTSTFFNAINTLGVDTTAITDSSVVPSSSWWA